MRRYLVLCLALALAVVVYSGSNASAQSWCAVKLSVHNHAWIMLKGKRLAQCKSGAYGCKCVSCYVPGGAVKTTCYPLAAPLPH